MSILSFYREMLESVNVFADENDQLILRLPDGEGETTDIPLSCKKRRVLLPTSANLNNGDWERQVIFHPLSELTHRGESDMMQRLRSLYLTRVQSVFAMLLLDLTQICANKDGHSELSPKASAVLSTMPQADAKTVKDVRSIIEASSFTGERKMLNLYTRRPGRIGATEYIRASYISVPLLELLKDETHKESIFGVKLRVKDRQGLAALIEYILPELDIEATYARGSRSSVAPTFDSAARSFIAIANRFNSVVKTFKKHLVDHKDLVTDTDWELHLDKLIDYDGLIPPQEGNIGSSATERDEPRPAAAVTAPVIGNAIIDAITPNPSRPVSKPATVTVEELAERLRQQNAPQQPQGWGAQPQGWGANQPQVSQTWGQNPAQIAASAGGGSTGADILNSMLARNGQAPAHVQYANAGYGGQPVQPANPRAGYNGILGAVPIQQPQPMMGYGGGNYGGGYPAQPYGNGAPV